MTLAVRAVSGVEGTPMPEARMRELLNLATSFTRCGKTTILTRRQKKFCNKRKSCMTKLDAIMPRRLPRRFLTRTCRLRSQLMSEGVKKDCVRQLMAFDLSSDKVINRHLVRRVMKMFVDEDGKVVTVENLLWTYLMNRLEHVVDATQNIYFKAADGNYVFFDIVPESPGAICDFLVAKHRLDPAAIRDAPECVVKASKREQEWWDDITIDRRPYKGDIGGSEKREKDKTAECTVVEEDAAKPEEVTANDQKKFIPFYRDHVDQDCEGVLPHRKLVKSPPSEKEIDEHLDRFFRPEGKLSDLYPVMNC